MKMFIDKFYRMHSPYYSKIQTTTTTTTTQSRSSKPNDASNMAQTLTREGFYFVQGKTKYMFIEESEDGKWDGINRVLKNIKDGVEANDAVSVGQILVCDNNKDKDNNKFVFNNKSFDFGNILVADRPELLGFRRMDGSRYLPENYVFKNMVDGHIESSKGGTFDVYKVVNGTQQKVLFSKIK